MASIKKKPSAKAAAPKKPARAKVSVAKNDQTKTKAAAKKTSPPKKAPAKAVQGKSRIAGAADMISFGQPVNKGAVLNPWQEQQEGRLLALKDTLLDTMTGMARENLRSGNDAHEASAHGLHQADAGSDAYDREFALNLLSQEQDALQEIDEALKRLSKGTYGICEMSNKSIPKARLEARPFARFTVECQTQIEKSNRFSRLRPPIGRLFDTTDDDSSDDSDDEPSTDSKD